MMIEQQQILITSRKLPLVEVSGSHLQMGNQIGEACREQIKHSIANGQTLLDILYDSLQLSWEGAQIQARKYIPFAEERYPQYIDEMRGIAEGADVEFDDVAVINAMEAVTIDALHLTKCTSLAVNQDRTVNNHVLVAHNEDWVPEDEPDVFLIRAHPAHEPPFLAMSYGCLLPNIGFNAYGVAQCCDSVYPNDCRIGIPRIVVSRAVLAAHTPGEAIHAALVPLRAAGYNHLLVHESGEMYNVEVSSRRFGLLYNEDGYLVHTNNYLDPQLQAIEYEPDELVSSQVRYFRALRLLKQQERHSIDSLQSILRDHINYPNSICNHHTDTNVDPLDREKTITSQVFDLTERILYETWGSPCENTYYTYQL